MSKKYLFESTVKIRDFECDMQGVVNNAYYHNLLMQTRTEFLASVGIIRQQWSEELAHELAALIDIELDEQRLEVLRFARDDQAKNGQSPTLNRLNKSGGFEVKKLYELFPGKPAKKIAWLAGIRKPTSCV